MTDKVKNYYELLKSDLKRERKVDTNFKKHHILPTSMYWWNRKWKETTCMNPQLITHWKLKLYA